MIYANDQWIQLPTVDLYDTLMMLASVLAAKDMYEKGLQAIKDFQDKYGDFYTLIPNDAARYNQIVGGVQNKINDLYSRGIDPLRSAEGRAEVARTINSIPRGELTNLKASAAAAEQYAKSRAALEAAGKYDPDFEERFLGYNLNDWDTGKMGVWNRMSPVEAKSLKELTEASYNNRTPHALSKDEVLSFPGAVYDPKAKYIGYTYDDLLDVANIVAPGLTGTVYSDYYRDLAKRDLINSGILPTEDNITAQLAKNIADSQREWLVKPEADYKDWYAEQNLNLKRSLIAAANEARRAQAEYWRNKANISLDEQLGWTARQLFNSDTTKDASKPADKLFAEWKANWKRTAKNKNGMLVSEIGKDDKTALQLYYSTWQHAPQGDDAITANYIFDAGKPSQNQQLIDGSTKVGLISFVNNDLRLRSVAEAEWAGQQYTKGSPTYKLNKYLHDNHIEGQPIGSVTINYRPTNRGTDLYEFNKTVRIAARDLEDFKKSQKDWAGVLENVGGTVVVRTRKYGLKNTVEDGVKPSNTKWQNIEYIDIPISRRIDASGYDNSRIDMLHDGLTLTKSVAAKRQGGYEQYPSSLSGNEIDYDLYEDF